MRVPVICLLLIANVALIDCRNPKSGDLPAPGTATQQIDTTVKTGTIASDHLVECSGIDISMIHEDLLWAVNDSGDGPYLYALGIDGQDRGRIRIAGATNQDWEDLATFNWKDRAMLLVADVGDNRQHRSRYRMYIIEEPGRCGEPFDPPTTVNVAWSVSFRYPNKNHDAEAVGVDSANGQILILTKRDPQPMLFSLPLKPPATDQPLMARQIAIMNRLPPPSVDDLRLPFGKFRSQPTAMDLTCDGLKMVVLTYKHAYLFSRKAGEAWQTIVNASPLTVALPLPQKTHDLVQREAACFSRGGDRLYVNSEGRHAGIYQVGIPNSMRGR